VNTIKEVLHKELDIHSAKFTKAVLLYRVINNSVRQKILRQLHNKKRMIVTDLYMDLNMEQCVMSQHLAILRKSGLVKSQREGKFIYYHINYPRLEQLHAISQKLIETGNRVQSDNDSISEFHDPGILTA
jgi:DNA-binding transcriptional ArsR family regulator